MSITHDKSTTFTTSNNSTLILGEIKNQSLFKEQYIELSENYKKVLEKRYLSKDQNGNVVETPDNMFQRVAKTIAQVSNKYNDQIENEETIFFNMMRNLEFLPNSPTLMNAGKHLGQLSACFVLPVEDSMDDIFESLKNTALIHKSGGGTGFSFSKLRPQNDIVSTTKGVFPKKN